MASRDVASLDASTNQVNKSLDVDRLYRTFTLKCLQVIVQSRIENSKDRILYENHFSLSLPDDPRLEDQLKKCLDGTKRYPIKDCSVCVEIPLVTNDGDHMFLETWDLTFNMSSLDIAVNKPQHIYTKMGITLKSLVCATRATPAYRLAKNQGEKGGGYKLNYRLYLGKPQTHNLGEGFKTYRAGAVPSSQGLLAISVSFRTRLLISPDMSSSSPLAAEMEDNHFNKEIPIRPRAPTPSKPQPCTPPQQSPVRPESPYCFAVSPTSNEQDDDYLRNQMISENQCFIHSSVFNMDELPEPVFGAFSERRFAHQQPVQRSELFEGLMRRSLMAQQMLSAAQQKATHIDDDNDADRGDHKNTTGKLEEEKENLPVKEIQSTPGKVNAVLEDDYIMVDKAPFAADEDPDDVKGFLGLIFRAPNLFETQDMKVSVDDYLSDVGDLVMKSEEDMQVLDEFCSSVIHMSSSEEEELRESSVFS